MTILGRETVIPVDMEQIFVRAQANKIAVGPYESKHADLAEKDGVFNEIGTRPRVDDGGVFTEREDQIKITPYFTTSCVVQAFADAVSSPEKPDVNELKKAIRRETAQLFADQRGKSVVVYHADHTSDKFFPR